MEIEKQEIILEKKKIRKRILEVRNSLSEEQRKKASYSLADKIIGHQWFYLAEQILCFISYGSEIDTIEIIEEALRKEKKVFVPKVEGEEMHFYRISSLNQLEAGYKGILEPYDTSEEYIYQSGAKEKTLMLMPGVAFDPFRRRLGYGKGFYDKYLADKKELQLHTIAIGFQCQMVEELPQDEQDIRPYQVILQKILNN